MRLARAGMALVAAGALLVSAGCATNDGPETQDIVTTIPWTAPERAHYDLTNRKRDDDMGEGTISIVRDGEHLVMRQEFRDNDGNEDTTEVRVDPTTLKPQSGRREIIDAKDDRREVLETEYGTLDDDSYGVRIKQLTYKPRTDTEPDNERSNPLRVPEHSYDNDTSLFIWRTIPFADDYTVTYNAIIANRRAKRPVTLHVMGQERVETPAGQFDAWHLRIEAEQQSHDAWFATTDDHTLLVYDNDRQVFLYTGEE